RRSRGIQSRHLRQSQSGPLRRESPSRALSQRGRRRRLTRQPSGPPPVRSARAARSPSPSAHVFRRPLHVLSAIEHVRVWGPFHAKLAPTAFSVGAPRFELGTSSPPD